MCNGDLMPDAMHVAWDSDCRQVEFFTAIGFWDVGCDSQEMNNARADCCQNYERNLI
jgi:hypothetical protein